jgi:drug/metabolite transporter (DMT)-like permease
MCLVWGSTFLAIRIGNEAVAPVWSATLRLLIAAPLYALIALATRAPWPRGEALRAALLYGFLNYGVQFALLYRGELEVPSSTSAILYATIPLTTAIGAAGLKVHPLRKHEMLGALVGLAGVVLVFSGELSRGGPPVALASVLVAATVAAFSGIALKMGPPQSTWAVNGIGAVVGVAVCLPTSLALGEPWTLPRGLAGWGPILYLIAAGNLVAYALYGWLITKWKVTSASAMSLVIPVVAVLLGALIRAEAPSPGTVAGAALVLVGVSITLFVGRR